MISWGEAVDGLESTLFTEEPALDAPPLLAVIMAPEDTLPTSRAEALTAALAALRAVTVAVLPAGEADAGLLDLVRLFDVVLRPEFEDPAGPAAAGDRLSVGGPVEQHLGRLSEATTNNAQSTVALVQLLRLGPDDRSEVGLSVAHGLVAESLTYSMLQSGSEFAQWVAQAKPALPSPDSEPPVLGVRHTAETGGDTLTITLNRPQRANAFSRAMRDELVPLLQVALADRSIAKVVLHGAGNHFCSGGDLGEFASFTDPAQAHATRLTRSPAALMHRLADRTVAHLHGACAGAGIELPAFARRVVAAADSDIWLPEISLGLVPGAGGTVSLPRRIGRHRTAWLALTGIHIDAPTALAWGLVDAMSGG